jgi:hypothetical protein
MLVWGGESLMGYLKVELRGANPQSRTFLLELRVYRSDGSVNSYSGLMVELPNELRPPGSAGVWQAFVHFPDSVQQNQMIVAMISPDGLLRLFVARAPDARSPSELRPLT